MGVSDGNRLVALTGAPHFERFLIDANVYLTPNTALGASMLACVPLAFTFRLDACAVD